MTISTFFIMTHRNDKDILSALHNEIDAGIELDKWREEEGAKGFYLLTLPEHVDFYQTYELFRFLQFNVTYINIPVEFWVTEQKGFENTSRIQREPLCTWKNIDRQFIKDPVPVDRMTGQISERLGLSPIMKVEKQRTTAKLGEAARAYDQKETYIFELGSERNEKETVIEITVFKKKDGKKLDWQEDLRQQLRIQLHHLMKERKLNNTFARKLGTEKKIMQLNRKELPTR